MVGYDDPVGLGSQVDAAESKLSDAEGDRCMFSGDVSRPNALPSRKMDQSPGRTNQGRDGRATGAARAGSRSCFSRRRAAASQVKEYSAPG